MEEDSMKVGGLYQQRRARSSSHNELIKTPSDNGFLWIFVEPGPSILVPFKTIYTVLGTTGKYIYLLFDGKIGWIYIDQLARYFVEVEM